MGLKGHIYWCFFAFHCSAPPFSLERNHMLVFASRFVFVVYISPSFFETKHYWRGWLDLAVGNWTNRFNRSNVCPFWKSQKGFSVRTDRSDYLACVVLESSIGMWSVVVPQLSDSIILYSCFISWNSKMKSLSRAVCFPVDIYSLIAFRFTSTFRRWPGEDMGSGDVVGGMVQKRGLQVHCLGSGRININEIYCTEFVDCYYYLHTFSNQMVFNDLFYFNLHFWEDSPLMIISLLGFWWATHLPTRFLGLPPRAGTWS